MHLWLGLLAGSIVTGACLVGVLVAPRRTQFIALAGLAMGALLVVNTFAALARSSAETIGLAIFFVAASVTGGYWTAAAALLHAGARTKPTISPASPQSRSLPAVVLLSCAEEQRYRISSTARVVERLISSGALMLPTSALPFVFLSEKTRYRALGGFNPARASVAAIADRLSAELADEVDAVEVAWCDGMPGLGEILNSLSAKGYRTALLLPLGPDGSFVMREAEHEAPADAAGLRLLHAPSIWRSDELAARLADRVIETTAGASLGNVGVVLAGEGQPTAWSSVSGEWNELENYFDQRVRLMLVERGISEQNIRMAWIEWQTPDVTETVRHLAALGCTRIVVAPSTLPHITLASALDLRRAIEVARLSEDVRVVALTPWGDDPEVVRALATAIREALRAS